MEQADNKFRIGEFTFDTFHEYRDGQEDLKKIECINKDLDIHDPKVAVRLYNMIRTGEIVFKSPIGDKFYAHIADIVADKSVGLIEVNDAVEKAEDKTKSSKIIGLACIGLAIIFFAWFGISELTDYISTRKMAALQDQKNYTKTDDSAAKSSITNNEIAQINSRVVDPSTLTVLPEYQQYLAQNPEFVGWLIVPDTQVNYPVLQRQSDNDYYLNHGFDGKEDSTGTLFMDYRCDYVNPKTNTIIYGHNMNNGSMFGELKKYLDESFYNTHKIISFDTLYEKREYEVVAVCLSKVEYQDDNNFRYYNFINADNDTEYDAFLRTVKNLSVYGDNINIQKTDKLLTLSTCNNYTEDGRLFVVAKRIK
ncbi:MAG: class B sortase [Lachnospiraceae bacterium]|nr:class B sortase [Lachnospiraceae bacterium]